MAPKKEPSEDTGSKRRHSRILFCAQQNFFVIEPNLFKIGDKTVTSVLFDIYFLDDDNVRISGPYSTFLVMAK